MTDDLDIEQPIEEAFPIMLEAAETLCRPAGNSGICYVYHRLWPYRRLLGAERRPLGRDHHIIRALRQMARETKLERVLISGSADYALFARVLHACRAEGIEPDVTVLDICDAPLHINRWYAERIGAKIRTIHRDILEFMPEEPFDAIVTDIFIVRIGMAHREQLIRTWHEALRPGGRVVTVERVTGDYPSGVRRVASDEIEARVRDLVARSQRHRELMPISQDTLASYVRDYYSAQETYPFRSPEEIRTLFEKHGFALATLQQRNRERRRSQEFSRQDRYEIVAERVA